MAKCVLSCSIIGILIGNRGILNYEVPVFWMTLCDVCLLHWNVCENEIRLIFMIVTDAC